MSEAVRTLKKLREHNYADVTIEGKLPSGIEFKITPVYARESFVYAEKGNIEKFGMGDLTGFQIGYSHNRFTREALEAQLTNMMRKYPIVEKELKFSVVPVRNETIYHGNEGKRNFKFSEDQERIILSVKTDFFFDERYVQFLRDFEDNLSALLQS